MRDETLAIHAGYQTDPIIRAVAKRLVNIGDANSHAGRDVIGLSAGVAPGAGR